LIFSGRVSPAAPSESLDETVFRYSNRATKDNPLNDNGPFFMLALSQVSNRRLTYKELTGKDKGAEGERVPF
jgi:hypothetical protein